MLQIITLEKLTYKCLAEAIKVYITKRGMLVIDGNNQQIFNINKIVELIEQRDTTINYYINNCLINIDCLKIELELMEFNACNHDTKKSCFYNGSKCSYLK